MNPENLALDGSSSKTRSFVNHNFWYAYQFHVSTLGDLNVTSPAKTYSPSRIIYVFISWYCPTPWWHCKQLASHITCLVQFIVLLWIIFWLCYTQHMLH